MPVEKKERRGNFYVDRTPKEEKPKKSIGVSPVFSRVVRRVRKIFIALLGLLVIIALAIGIGRLFIMAYDTAVTSSTFLTKKIDVEGNVRLPRELVLKFAGIHEGMNSLAVNIQNVERNLSRTPWVEAVSVKRVLPDAFVIKIRERMPSYWVHEDGVLYYADDEARIIAPVESSNFLSLPAVTVEEGADSYRKYLRKFKDAVSKGQIPFDMAAISQITLSLSKGFEIYLEDREIWLSFDPTDWETNVSRIQLVFTDLIKRREMKNVREIRVVDGNVWVILNTSARSLSQS